MDKSIDDYVLNYEDYIIKIGIVNDPTRPYIYKNITYTNNINKNEQSKIYPAININDRYELLKIELNKNWEQVYG